MSKKTCAAEKLNELFNVVQLVSDGFRNKNFPLDPIKCFALIAKT
jgi:hypothetical protein